MIEKAPTHKSMFLAIELDDSTQRAFADTLYLQGHKKEIRWEKRQNFHVTIGFIKSVSWENRDQVMLAFEPMKELSSFKGRVEGVVGLGRNGHTFCAKIGPNETLLTMHLLGDKLLKQNTEYMFDDTHSVYIPHTKIQTVKQWVTKNKLKELYNQFMKINIHKLEFFVERLALMHRVKDRYETLRTYRLS